MYVYYRAGEVQEHKSEWLTRPGDGLVKTCLLAFYYAFYYAILFFTTLFTTLRENSWNWIFLEHQKLRRFAFPRNPRKFHCQLWRSSSNLRLLVNPDAFVLYLRLSLCNLEDNFAT